jgi:hypothetical protein
VESSFGAGWVVSTDALRGGTSKAEMAWTEGGAAQSRGCLKISGEILAGGPSAWAGAMFMPGSTMMAPVDLPAGTVVRFKAKGTPRAYAFEAFARALGYVPAIFRLEIGPEWREFAVPLADLKLDGSGIMGLFFGAIGEAGAFSLWLDDIRLK